MAGNDLIEIDGVLRPRFNSTGQVIHSTEEGIGNFWAWFGDSKAVDGQGRPLVIYHGSPDVRGIFDEGFRAYSRGAVWFASDSYHTANTYADDRRAFDYQNAEPQTIPLYLYAENMMVVDAKYKHWRDTERHVKEAKEAVHDGIMILNSVDEYNNTHATKASTVYAWFDPSQVKSAIVEQLKSRIDKQPIKSAIGNSGAFSKGSRSLSDDQTVKQQVNAEIKRLLPAEQYSTLMAVAIKQENEPELEH